MIDIDLTSLDEVYIHFVGNKLNDEALVINPEAVPLNDNEMLLQLYQYFLSHFDGQEMFQFKGSMENAEMVDLELACGNIFKDPTQLGTISSTVADLLYDASNHPAIKSGYLCVVYFSKINFQDEITDAVGIFKVENMHPFFQFEENNKSIEVRLEEGVNIQKPDKACIIFNAESVDGYRVFMIDKSSKGVEASFWKNDFLNIMECSNEYYYTKNLMDVTSNFVKNKMTEDFEVARADQIDLLNKTKNYFNNNEAFDQEEFSESIFGNEEVANSFNKYKRECAQDLAFDMPDNFEISYPAVKKKNGVFKSILKLDKNFSVYVHGDRSKIERGIEEDGRRFYKLYFDNEA